MKTYNLTNDEAVNWQPDGMFLRIIEQPPDGYRHIHTTIAFDNSQYADFVKNDSVCHIKLPFAVGDIVGCKETWGEARPLVDTDGIGAHYAESKIIYKADYTEEQLKLMYIKWRSPVTMPLKAIHKWIKIVSVECRRIQTLSIKQMVCLFQPDYKKGYKDHFNSLHAKPQPVKEHGKIVSYVAYPYDMQSFLNLKYYDEPKENNVSSLIWTYKHKQLKVIANPYVVLCGHTEVKA